MLPKQKPSEEIKMHWRLKHWHILCRELGILDVNSYTDRIVAKANMKSMKNCLEE